MSKKAIKLTLNTIKYFLYFTYPLIAFYSIYPIDKYLFRNTSYYASTADKMTPIYLLVYFVLFISVLKDTWNVSKNKKQGIFIFFIPTLVVGLFIFYLTFALVQLTKLS